MIRQTSLELSSPLNTLISNFNLDIKELEYIDIPDEKLASLYVNNKDDYAFNELVSRYGDKIFRLAMRITKSPQIAEEVLQSVFVKLVEKLGMFRGESKLSTWIFSITTNECFRYIRNRNKNNLREISVDEYNDKDSRISSEGLPIKDEDSNPEDTAINLEQREILDRAIDELSEEYRVVFQLRDIEGLSNNETAEVLGLSLSAVKSRILRARTQIKNKLSNSFPEYKN